MAIILWTVVFAALGVASAKANWKSLNSTLNGALVRAFPVATPCHVPINQDACDIARKNWTNQFWRAQQPGGYFDLNWENGDNLCDINGNASLPCTQGLVPYYVAQVNNVDDVKKAVKFAHDHKISTRVKGASHDFLGRSSGNGTFGISTIKLKGINFVDSYTLAGAPPGASPVSVVHVAAGEHWIYVNRAADAHGVIVVGGASYSVGAAGGWVLGGGHSNLSPQYGLGVDNVVQFEIVTPDGRLRVANRYQEKDLFWALRGGGPGFGVVTKVTYRTHPAIKAITAMLFNATYTNASFTSFLREYLALQPTLSAHNVSGYSYPTANGIVAQLLVHNSANLTALNSTLKPMFDLAQSETSNGRPAKVETLGGVLPSYLSLFNDDPATVNERAAGYAILGSRLAPASAFQGDKVQKLADFMVKSPFTVIMHLVAGNKVSQVAGDATAIHPSWRKAIHHLVLAGGWDNSQPLPTRNLIRSALTSATQEFAKFFPGFGSYVNEGDINEPKWQETFWGSNYPRLKSIKNRYDPRGIFTCFHCVGYED
ncbi:related to FAD binding domain protein-Neosartorya fischeri [Serendipita indica DSM 11827]|uniref:Related to FAD binding domain protein-Neosartorya fischeri n=1 Tax=Serendipita indica (strain DSM 11827) TaxID=1109443 RepID=G4TQL6_SERID|nr:related to FAD binding domain protein-Neosartorya fischeri [Serendipita indica DSM 11827]